MGLDMYLRGRKSLWQDFRDEDNNRTEDGLRIEAIEVELGYWRKHPNLHGYIVQAFADGKDDCQDIRLNGEALRKIIAATTTKTLPVTEGFFFGQSTEEDDPDTIRIMMHAIAWLETKVGPHESRYVIYRASW